jgi:uncharacterized protein (TIGR03435 family)
MQFLIALVLFSASVLAAQDLSGTWQGTIQTDKELRIVLKISKAENGTLKAVFDSIDGSGLIRPVNPITLQGTTLNFAILGIGGSYEGKLSADGNSITGSWTQGNTWPLKFTRATTETAWEIPEPPSILPPMADDAVFDVSTIKPTKPGTVGRLATMRGHELITRNRSLIFLMEWAFTVQAHQIIGVPAWAETENYDVDAKTEAPGQASDHQMKMMIRKLLEERFKLKYHWDKKELPVYELVVGKDGPKLTKSVTIGDLHSGGGSGNHRTFSNYAMQNLCDVLGRYYLAKPMVDKTGLKDRYDFSLDWTPDEFQYSVMGVPVPPPSESADAPPNLFTALQQQLGLKLREGKFPVDVLVIDHIEKPSEN